MDKSGYLDASRDEMRDKILARLAEMWVVGEIKRGTARFNEEADYWEGWMDACKHAEKFIKGGCIDGKDPC